MKNFKVFLFSTIFLLVTFFCASCTEPFVAGFGTGVATMAAAAEQSKTEFNKSMEKLNAEKAEIDKLIDKVDDADTKAYLQSFADEQTAKKIAELNEKGWTDPVTLAGYILAIGSTFTAGYQKYKRIKGS